MNPWPSLTELAQQVRSGAVSASQLVAQSLQAIKDKDDYKAVLWSLDDAAVARAEAIDAAIARGENPGVLAGVPFIAKDNFLVKGAQTTAASNILKGFDGVYQATAINKLEAQGAICVAKANLDAFGHGGSSENSDYQLTKNAKDPSRVPGGSSGGSATAVALQLAPFALGTDTGGSSRQPAAFSGVVGYKPSYGLISRSGVVAMASSCDTVGVITNTAQDLAVVVDVLAGPDELDGSTIERDVESYAAGHTVALKGAKIGIIKEFMAEGMSDEVRHATEQAIATLKEQGADVSMVSLPSTDASLGAYYIIVPAEISSNLSRYDGQRYGYTHPDAKTLEESYANTRDIGFGREAQRRIIIGTFVLSSGYFDAYYKKAQLVRTKIAQEFADVFTEVDYIISPTAPTVAFKPGEKSDPLAMYLADAMTVSTNLAGVPAISLPVKTDGLPVGLQIMAAYRQDHNLLAFSKQIEELIK